MKGPQVPELVLFYRDRNGSPAWQPVGPRHAGDPGVTSRTEAEAMSPQQREEITLAAERGALGRAGDARARTRRRYGRMHPPGQSAGPQPHFMWEGRGTGVILWFLDLDDDGNDRWVIHDSMRRVREDWDADSNDWVQRDLGPARLSEPRHPLFPDEEQAGAYRRDLLARAPRVDEALLGELAAGGGGARLVLTPEGNLVVTADPRAPGRCITDAAGLASRVPAYLTLDDFIDEANDEVTAAL